MKSFYFLVLFLLSSSVCYSEELCKTKCCFPIAASEALMDEAARYMSSGDKEAFMKLMDTKLVGVTGDDNDVYVVEWGFSRIQVRAPGSRAVLWTVPEAVKCKKR